MKELGSAIAIIVLVWLSLTLYANSFTYRPDTFQEYRKDTLGQAQ